MKVFLIMAAFLLALALLGAIAMLILLSLRYRQPTGELGVPPARPLLRWAERVRGWLGRGEARLTAPSERLLNMAHAHLVSQYLITVVRLNIAEAFDTDARPAAAVAEELELHPASVAHMLRVLAAHGCFEIIDGTENMVRHNALSRLLRADHPMSIRPIMLVLGETYASSALMPHMASTGEPTFVRASSGLTFAESTFVAGDADKKVSVAGDAMIRAAETSLLRLSEGGLLADHDWSSYKRVIDLSAMHGRFLAAILRANPGVAGLVWDTPGQHEVTQSWWSEASRVAPERVSFGVGEAMSELPQVRSGDAVLLAFVLNALDDTMALELLRSLRHQIGLLGVPLLIADIVIEERSAQPTQLLLDAQARGMGPIRHRTKAGWNALLVAAGFSLVEVSLCRGYASLIQARPAQGVDLSDGGQVRSQDTKANVPKEEASTKKPLLRPNAA